MFYQKLKIELQKSNDATMAQDLELVQMAENLYASSSEQKYQMRQHIDWITKLPASIQTALGRIAHPDSPSGQKITLIYHISQEINASLAQLSFTNPNFVQRLKKESMSQIQQFKVALSGNEAEFVKYFSKSNAAQIENHLDGMINYYHSLNNYLRYCLPISPDILSESACNELRTHYFNEIQRFGIRNNPGDPLLADLSSLIDKIKQLESSLNNLAHMAQQLDLAHVAEQLAASHITVENVQEFIREHQALTQANLGQQQPQLPDQEHVSSDSASLSTKPKG